MENPDQNIHKGEPLRYLVFSASLRINSLNTRLVRLAARRIEQQGGIVDFANMEDFSCPSYDQDRQEDTGFPDGAKNLRQRLETCDAFLISSPEYNASMPGHLKNVIDWVSRFHPQPFHELHCLLMSASPSMAGGNRGLWALRIPLEHLGTRVFPDMFSLAAAHKAFTSEGEINDSGLTQRFNNTISAFMSLVEAAKNYPCIKKAWIEFLGEKPDPAADQAG